MIKKDGVTGGGAKRSNSGENSENILNEKKTYNNRLLYSLIALGVLMIAAVGVYAGTTISNTGISTNGTLNMSYTGGNYTYSTQVSPLGYVALQAGRNDGGSAMPNLSLQVQGGNVGIGTTTPAGKLSIFDSTSDVGVSLLSGANSQFWINTYGNILRIGGVGSTQPTSAAPINIKNTGTIGINGSSATSTTLGISVPHFDSFFSSTNNPSSASLMAYGNILAGNFNPNSVAYIGFMGYQSALSYSLAFAGMKGSINGTSSDVTSKLDFLTTADNVPQVRMTIGTDGKVGIGTASPRNPLNVIGAINATTGFIVGANTGTTGNYTNGNCWTAYSGGIVYSTNCTAA